MAITLSVARNDEASRSLTRFGIAPSQDTADTRTLSGNLRSLRQYAMRQSFARNEVIFEEGDAARTIYKIISGTVRLCRHTEDGRRHIAEFLLPGDVFGIVEGKEHPLTAEAVTEVTLTSYPRANFDRLVEANPSAQANVMGHMSLNLASARHHHFVLSCQNARERVMSFLVRLAARTDVFAGDRLDIPMGRQDIADHLGLTIETVSRSIGALKADGCISVPNAHQLILRNTSVLHAHAA